MPSPRPTRLAVYQALTEQAVLPIFNTADTSTALRISRALAAGGARVSEFTNRGPGAIRIYREVIGQLDPDVIFGAGSIEDAATAALFLAEGAHFIVAPNFSAEVSRLCNRYKVAYIPGCSTVSEIAEAEEAGVEIVKLFPASVLTPDFVKHLHGPRPWSTILATGGIKNTPEDIGRWLRAGAAGVGLGSSLIPKEALTSGNDALITEQVVRTLGYAAEARV